MSEPLRGTVTRVLGSREMKITARSTGGVMVGMYFDWAGNKAPDSENKGANTARPGWNRELCEGW